MFAARAGYEKVSFAQRVGQFQLRLCRRPTRGRQSPRPLDPGLRPASPPLRGPFASSGFLTERQDAPSLARSRLFATSLSLVLKSLIRSAVLTASLPPAVISSFCVGYFIAVGFLGLALTLTVALSPADNTAPQLTQRNHRRGFGRGIRSAEEQPEARMSRQDVGERTVRARDGASGRSAGRRA